MLKKALRVLEPTLVCFPNLYMIYRYFYNAIFPWCKDYFDIVQDSAFFYFTIPFFVGLFEYKRHNRLRFYLWELGPFILLMLYLIIGLWPYWGEIIQMLLTSAGIMDEA